MMKKKETLIPLLVSFMLAVGFCMLFHNHNAMFNEVEKAYAEGTAINLDKDTKAGELARVLCSNGYFANVEDANFVAGWITSKLHDHAMPNLGTLNKKEFGIPVHEALASGGPYIRERAREAMQVQGFTPEVERMYSQPLSGNTQTGEGEHLIKAVVLRPDSNSGFWKRIWKNAVQSFTRKPTGQPVPGVIVCLRGYSYDKSYDAFGNEACGEVRDSVIAYGVTDTCGVAQFHVPEGYYSVLPVAKAKTYGSPKGTSDDMLHTDREWFFTEKEMTIAPLSPRQFAQAKQDMSLTVRTPSQYKDGLIACLFAFLAAWWAGWLLLSWLDNRSAKPGERREGGHEKAPVDRLVYFMLMALTALCVLAMFGISMPLTDMSIGVEMTQGVIVGLVALCVFSRISLPVFSNRRMLRNAGAGTSGFLPEGFRYFIFALLLMSALLVFGSGPDGSGAKVNLFFFQPSEVVKYLIVIMMAFFFTRNAKLIQAFSQQADFRRQARLLAAIGACMLFLMAFFAILSDMGPALVAILTFILLYSVARQDTPQLIIGLLTYVAALLLARWFNPTPTTAMMVTLAWLVAWLGLSWLNSGKIYESAVMMALVISTFSFFGDFLGALGFDDIASRLAGRNAMAWSGIWHNDVKGGDQVAHGIWGLASGGLTGQGLGHGYPSSIPAFHSDMILCSIGESLGWISVALIIVCLTVLLHRTLLLGRRAGNRFVFFLLTGIGIATGIQFFVITTGCLGLIPLTGVAAPFISYGKASMIINLAAFGAVLSGSRERGTDNQREDIKAYNNVEKTSILTFILLAAVVLTDMLDYQAFHRNKNMVRPALMVDVSGMPFAEYNPRIKLLETKMQAGNIYDRNGLILATSNPDDIRREQHRLEEAGLARTDLSALAQNRQQRYYPFGMHTVFAVGDLNEGLVRDGNADFPIGYGAEYRHMTRLRGIDNLLRDSTGSTEMVRFRSSRFRPCRFLPKKEESFSIPMRDYSDPRFVAMLKGGGKNWLLEKWNEERDKRDIRLTIDAKLQTMMQRNMESTFRPITDAAGGNSARRKMRVSVVVTDAASGDLLCSANYPLPTRQSILLDRRYSSVERDRDAVGITPQDLGTTFGTPPGSTAKVITQMAAFQKLGSDASNLVYTIRANEPIHEKHLGAIGMRRALVHSNNAFHIHLAHDKNLYQQYAAIDYLTGIRLHVGLSGENRRSYTPYYFHPGERLCDSTTYTNEMSHLSQMALPRYRHLREQGMKVNNRPWTASALFQIAWGQNHILPTPLAMARVAAIVANEGKFVPTRFLADEPVMKPVAVIDTASAHFLQESMRAETQKHQDNSKGTYTLPATMGGKTGTAERSMPGRRNLVNDAWYICFIPRQDGGTLAVSIRIERAVSNSSMAVRYINNLVLQTLRDAGYRIDGE